MRCIIVYVIMFKYYKVSIIIIIIIIIIITVSCLGIFGRSADSFIDMCKELEID